MKTRLVLFSLLIFYSCNQKNKSSKIQDSEIKQTIDLLLNNWHKNATEANFDSYFNLMDSVSIFIGTDASENWTKQEFQKFCKPFFDNGKAWDFKVLERNIYISKTSELVWFDELLNTWMGTCRGSGVLELSNNEWKLKHYVLSIPIPNDDVNSVIKIKSNNDSIFLSNYLKNR